MLMDTCIRIVFYADPFYKFNVVIHKNHNVIKLVSDKEKHKLHYNTHIMLIIHCAI